MREAIVRLHDWDLASLELDAVVDVLRAAGLQDVAELDSEGVHQVRVAEPIPAAELERLDAIEWWEAVDESQSGATYLWKARASPCDEACPLDEHSTAYEISAVRERGFDLTLVGSHDEIGRSIERMLGAGVNVDLERLSELRGPTSTMDRLTDRQREVLRTAHSLGYYDVPRRTSTEDLAEELNLEPSTVSEHLQRAERNLVDDVLVPGE
ncbi:helix-turn-helix domain-containing protein [Natronoarchaeum mannanilyticum]|uniref:HTH bat-type domain-containing protein n=1 Tax=Natronoarchaeum mannanilyticum TaxID=926360 RepID=A0AAV3TEL0_9EURY